MEIRRQLAAIPNTGEAEQFGSGATLHEKSLRLFCALGDDIDYSIDSVRAPQSAARSTNHLYPINIFQQRVLNIPEYSGKQWCINRAAIHQDQKFVCEGIIEAACADGPLV